MRHTTIINNLREENNRELLFARPLWGAAAVVLQGFCIQKNLCRNCGHRHACMYPETLHASMYPACMQLVKANCVSTLDSTVLSMCTAHIRRFSKPVNQITGWKRFQKRLQARHAGARCHRQGKGQAGRRREPASEQEREKHTNVDKVVTHAYQC